jgi:hypothetical protein
MASIGVYARIRPTADVAKDGVSVPEPTQILVRNLEFSLDRVFEAAASQEEVYEVVGRERVAKVVEGFNVCVLAYGQTGSGKTHTMFGPDDVLADWRTSSRERHGLALRAISDLFEGSAAASVACSYLEVYNDTCNDLLGQQKALPLRETAAGAPYVAGLKAEPVATVDEAMEVLARGTSRRTTAQMSSQHPACRALRTHPPPSTSRPPRPAPARRLHPRGPIDSPRASHGVCRRSERALVPLARRLHPHGRRERRAERPARPRRPRWHGVVEEVLLCRRVSLTCLTCTCLTCLTCLTESYLRSLTLSTGESPTQSCCSCWEQQGGSNPPLLSWASPGTARVVASAR